MVLAHGLCIRCHERKMKAEIQIKVLLRESKKMQEVVKQIAPF